MEFAYQHLQQARHHISEIDEHIVAQRAFVGEKRAQGRETAEEERLLFHLLEAQRIALAHRRLILERLEKPAPQQ